MEEQPQRIAEDLAGLFEGELRFDETAREIYSTDASLYQIRPLGVAYPRHSGDIVTLAQYAAEAQIPLIPRGAGSGLAGGALGAGIIVDCSRHLTGIGAIQSDTVRVEVGVVRNQLNRRLRQYERYFAPDPSSTAVTTIGGMLAVDAAGAHAVRVGSTRDHVKSVEVVLADGSSFEAGIHSRYGVPDQNARRADLVRRLANLLSANEELIQQKQPPLMRNCSGYHLRTALEGEMVNLPRLLVGSEGTLALFTAATLHTSPLPAARAAALLLFQDLERALEAVRAVAPQVPTACDLLDRRLLSLAREADERFEAFIPRNAEAAVLIEQSGEAESQVRKRLANAIALARQADPRLLVGYEAYTFDDVEFLWSLPYRVVALLNRLEGPTRPLPIVEDIAVAPEVLHEFLVKAQRVFQRHWLTASLYAHAASGQVHFRPFLTSPCAENAQQIESLARELYEVALACGGTISGEHGNGLSRTAFIRSQYGPLYRVFQQVKEIFDPQSLLNPDKIISDDPHLTIRNFRTVIPEKFEGPVLVPLQLAWKPQELAETTRRCNGCGDCRVQSDALRMCPFFHVEHLEDASPRAKANLIRPLAAQTIDPRIFSTEEAKQLADRCFNCKQCQLECPSNVNIPALAIEAKAQCVAAGGLSRADWILARAHSFGRLGCRFSPLANWALAHRGVRWLMEQFLGVSRLRRLPRFARREFLKSVKTAASPATGKSVVYFVDHFANFHDPEIGHALVKVLAHHGIQTIVPRGQVASGMAMVSAGDLEAARELAEINVRILAEHARNGQQIICTEPTAALCLKHEYPRLLQHPDVELVAEQTIEAGAYLWGLHEQGQLKTDFQEVSVQLGYHTPCHLKFLSPQRPLASLMGLIPGVDLKWIERGCSGMAGAYGLTAQNFENSLAMGAGLIAEMQRPDFQAGATECSSCKMQMEQKSQVPTIHPLKVLAHAYGLLPELKDRLGTLRTGKLVSS